MGPVPILPSNSDLERRRLESTIDNDLHSLSLSSLPTSTTSHSHSHSHSFLSSNASTISLEYPRAETMSFSSQPHHHHHHHQHRSDYGAGSDTPRARAQPPITRVPSTVGRMTSFGGAGEQSMFVGASPVSTAGHHASAVSLGAGVFGKGNRNAARDAGDGSEFDPERSLGRLVGELGRVMGSDKLPSRPSSPFSPPRSPSPLPSVNQVGNLSFTLTRTDPLLSPPSSGGEQTITQKDYHHPQHIQKARQGSATPAAPRRALSDSTSHNVMKAQAQTPVPPRKEKSININNRIHSLQDENRRPASAPCPLRSANVKDSSMDVTGYTNLMATPAKGFEYGTLGKNGEVGGDPASANIASTLATLNARLRALETENTVSRRRVRELEDELEKARGEVEIAKKDGGKRLRDVIGEKSALEDLVNSLRSHLVRLTVEVESNKALIAELRLTSSPPQRQNTAMVPPGSPSVSDELAALRREIERLSAEVSRLGGIVEEGLETRKKARGERTIRMEREEMERLVRQVIHEENEEQVKKVQRDMERRKARMKENETERETEGEAVVEPSKLRQGLHTAASTSPTLAPPTAQPPTRILKTQRQQEQEQERLIRPEPSHLEDDLDSPTPASRSISRQGSLTHGPNATIPKTKSRPTRRADTTNNAAGPSSPFPSIVGDELEAEFFSPSRKTQTKSQTQTQFASALDKGFIETQAELRSQVPSRNSQRSASGTGSGSASVSSARKGADGQELPPQTVLARVVRELEDDFAHYKAIYSELADQYKILDPASISSKRHVLAEHLKEVIDVLEQKADQIGDLYELLEFSDRPISPPAAQSQSQTQGEVRIQEGWIGKSVGDVLRMVKSSLGEEVFERLEDDLKVSAGMTRRRKSGGIEI
uniref:Cep57 centrosome microtubule-binding domain-containing protein n=1 Tax=Kwoniella dejecticola CBS 10117 TaxID=1296121 RepID=A0A1A6AHB5_9TREE|nr:uncharacterized protein I303_01289 [Kwoniella dejecticola CBS 10117]OBR89462.1 hypothetical protein I303_01289 [Kwoniella dejecticola CBS 10117]